MNQELRRIFKSIRSNCKARGKTSDLTYDELVQLWNESGGKCMLTGIDFDLTPFSGKRRPFAASIDRIDPALGYSKANCRLVCTAVNYAMSDWGLAVLRKIAHAIIERDPGDYVPGGRGLKGVTTRRERGRTVFESNISTPRGRIYLARFPTAWDAHKAYLTAQREVRSGQPIQKRREAKSINFNSDIHGKPQTYTITA